MFLHQYACLIFILLNFISIAYFKPNSMSPWCWSSVIASHSYRKAITPKKTNKRKPAFEDCMPTDVCYRGYSKKRCRFAVIIALLLILDWVLVVFWSLGALHLLCYHFQLLNADAQPSASVRWWWLAVSSTSRFAPSSWRAVSVWVASRSAKLRLCPALVSQCLLFPPSLTPCHEHVFAFFYQQLPKFFPFGVGNMVEL